MLNRKMIKFLILCSINEEVKHRHLQNKCKDLSKQIVKFNLWSRGWYCKFIY